MRNDEELINLLGLGLGLGLGAVPRVAGDAGARSRQWAQDLGSGWICMAVIGVDWRGFGTLGVDWRGFGLKAFPIKRRKTTIGGHFDHFVSHFTSKMADRAQGSIDRFCKFKILIEKIF